MYIRVDVTFPISESSTVNAAASWISICLTIYLCLGFSPDRPIWSSTFLWCSLILISGTASVLVSLFTSFATVGTTAWCICTVWHSCSCNGVMLEILLDSTYGWYHAQSYLTLVLSLLFTRTFMGLKPRIGCCKTFSITKKSICNRCVSSPPWPVSLKVRSTQPTNGISAWFLPWTLSLSHGSKISSILETLRSFKWVFNQALWHLCSCIKKDVLRRHFSPINWTFWSLSDGTNVVL